MSHLWYITLAIIFTGVLKHIAGLYVQIKTLEISNKNKISVEISQANGESRILHIESSELKLEDLKNNELLNFDEFKNKAIEIKKAS